MDILIRIGQKIITERKKRGLTQEDLAGLCDMDRSYLSEVENGHKNISVLMLEKIAQALNLEVVDILKASSL